MITIIQSFYYSINDTRQTEIEFALMQNLNKNYVKNIHLFIENKDLVKFKTSTFYKNNKIIIVNFEGQPTYPVLFNYSSNLNNEYCCICNSDIELNIENIKIVEHLKNNKLIYFITRHEHDMSCPLIDNFGGSHDAFIFHSDTMKKNLNNINTNFINYIQNTSGIEALLTIYFIEQLNYKILNPCYQIVLLHHHKSQVRLWNTGNQTIPVGYTHPIPLKVNWGVHNKYIIKPCNINL